MGEASSTLVARQDCQRRCRVPLQYADTILSRDSSVFSHSVAYRSSQILSVQGHFLLFSI